MGKKLSLKEAQQAFNDLLETVEPKEAASFVHWVADTLSTDDSAPSKPASIRDATLRLHEIALHIRERIPVSATVSSEQIMWPKIGYDSDCNSGNTVNVDCFLFDDAAVDELVSAGSLSRSYCSECGSHNTKPLTFISHSLSIPQLEFIFTSLVPLAKKAPGYRILDIGSRLGGVVAAAHLFSNGKAHVTGIELNDELCKLQESVKADFGLDSVSVVASDVREQAEIVRAADLIVMNNVFCFFANTEEQASCWRFLHETMRPGALLVHNPKVEEVTEHLKLPFSIMDWLKPIKTKGKAAKFSGGDEELFEDCAMLSFYEVRGGEERKDDGDKR